MILKAEDELLENIVILKEGTQDMQNIYSWFEEYSNIKQLQGEKKIISRKSKDFSRKTSLAFSIDKINNNQISSKNDYFSNKNFVDNKFDVINFGDENLTKIEDKNFDIFELENTVGKENILTVIGTYIFMEEGLYSCINYQNFEKFLLEIAKGYIRENSYHTVNYINLIGL